MSCQEIACLQLLVPLSNRDVWKSVVQEPVQLITYIISPDIFISSSFSETSPCRGMRDLEVMEAFGIMAYVPTLTTSTVSTTCTQDQQCHIRTSMNVNTSYAIGAVA